uniref:Uncharacterized protein n=1 Tax=Dunaliella tertiolecta TaxID=3047 RepID=A0A7S3VPK0_DUNTE|mmetsp:Transcript_19720/g.51179  ORF Transcript_19720/g.51179 Transcript_19720/m.51179 type:complete len:179 (+) Transcript_19720:97-633(+)|eukprot:CAMPEP_0202342878 /NCGR_PEP_ID=MMETSP1126-20121109/3252_1 /ASSEMBLY_ACC=CAM_ASM_000457 /TAXON_ID=3047 /ORGANISM="Dunaliella tertiolecta, Strain CCMP1320" /LENGTH=178 /DNA_ID=CAMNT_0048933893 /DNA_START=70 /DNA_END=606 /DNA_ORIENTATION=+
MGNEKTALKEGGKKGQDLSGMAALGGVCFFNVSAEEPNGDWKLLEKVMEGANAPVDEAAEERKGGAGDIGKFFFSAGDDKLIAFGHMPKSLESKGLGLKEWTDELLKKMPGAQVLESSDEYAKIEMKADTEKGIFPLKIRDEAITAGFQLFKAKGLVPANADSDSDDVNYAEAAGVEW